MIKYLLNKIKKHRAKRLFEEYGHKIIEFNLLKDGTIKYAQWLNPLEDNKQITQSQVNFFRKFIKKGDLVIDIGAHTGDTPIPMGLAAGLSGTVLALEPNPYIFKILKENASLNKDKTNIVPLCFAATPADGEFYYNSSEASFNNGGLSDVQSEKHGRFSMSQKVKGVNLENYLYQNFKNELAKLSLIKVDTEGHDKEVLINLISIIKEFRPVIIFECFRELKKEERESLFDLIAKESYDLFYFSEFSEHAVTKPIYKKDLMNWKHFDIYALPQ